MQIFLAYVKKKQYFCSRFCANYLRWETNRCRDVGIGRQERLKIFCPVMGVPVRPRLAVQNTFTGATYNKHNILS